MSKSTLIRERGKLALVFDGRGQYNADGKTWELGVADILGSCEEMDDKRRFEELLDYIHENCGAIMASKDLKVEPNICSTLFQKYLNTTPMEYIRQYRIEKGCHLLVQTNKTVAEISKECGMNYSYFSRRIQEETGVTPMEYRRAYYRSQTEQK